MLRETTGIGQLVIWDETQKVVFDKNCYFERISNLVDYAIVPYLTQSFYIRGINVDSNIDLREISELGGFARLTLEDGKKVYFDHFTSTNFEGEIWNVYTKLIHYVDRNKKTSTQSKTEIVKV